MSRELNLRIGSVAMIVRDQAAAYLGTCFPFRWANVFLTARHCVEGIDPTELVIDTQYRRQLRVVAIHHHADADVSMLITDRESGGVPYPFFDAKPTGTYHVGEEFAAFGFPEGGTFDEPSNRPTPRVFRGYVQRSATFSSGGSNPYTAFELSVAAPSGLSGGPVFEPTEGNGVFGVVTGNIDTYTTETETSEVDVSGKVHTTSVRRIISYGMALSIPFVSEWLREVSPAPYWVIGKP